MSVLTDVNRFDLMDFDDQLKTTCQALYVLLSSDGVLAGHLNAMFEWDHRLSDEFVDHPHVHWWMNGLFQANSGGVWEDAAVAYLEPLRNFKHVMGCAPYDVMTMGAHQLSSESCILVPAAYVGLVSAHLSGYHGEVIGYPASGESFRQVVNRTLRQRYHGACQLLNKHGNDINGVGMSSGNQKFKPDVCRAYDYNQGAGYFRELFVRMTEGGALEHLMNGKAGILLQSYRTYAEGRFVGLHSSSPTDIERIPCFKILKRASQREWQREISQHAPMFIGLAGARRAHDLICCKVYAKSTEMRQYSTATGMHINADYLLIKALIADVRSVHIQAGRDAKPSPLCLRAVLTREVVGRATDALAAMCKDENVSTLEAYRQVLAVAYMDGASSGIIC